MAHNHSYPLSFLETPFGYLTSQGVTDDINDKNLVILRANTYGIWASLERKVKYFLNFAELEDKQLEQNIKDNFESCKVLTYSCGSNSCSGCYKKEKLCTFWNGNRSILEYYRIY